MVHFLHLWAPLQPGLQLFTLKPCHILRFAESFIYCDLASVALYKVPVAFVCALSFRLVHVIREEKHVQGVEYLRYLRGSCLTLLTVDTEFIQITTKTVFTIYMCVP